MLLIRKSKPTGGKAGKGCNRTSTIQVFDQKESRVLKSFRYTVVSRASFRKACDAAIEYAKETGEVYIVGGNIR